MIKFSPSNWPVNAPDYWSPAGYEYQKMLARKALIAEVTIVPWLVNQKSFLRLQVAARLAEIVDHPLAAHYRKICDALENAHDASKRTVGNYEVITHSAPCQAFTPRKPYERPDCDKVVAMYVSHGNGMKSRSEAYSFKSTPFSHVFCLVDGTTISVYGAKRSDLNTSVLQINYGHRTISIEDYTGDTSRDAIREFVHQYLPK